MLLVLDDDNCIVKYSLIGGLADDNAVEFDEEKLPEDFVVKFQPRFYKLENDGIVVNPDYVVPDITVPNDPTNLDKAVADLILRMAKQSEKQDKFNAELMRKLAQLGGGANV